MKETGCMTKGSWKEIHWQFVLQPSQMCGEAEINAKHATGEERHAGRTS